MGVDFTIETRGRRVVAEAEGIAAARFAARTLIEEGQATLLYLWTPTSGIWVERWYLGGGKEGGQRAGTYVACETSTLARKYEGR